MHFTPSLLMSLDDPILNATFLRVVLESYTDPKTGYENHYLLSPLYAPDDIIKKYPQIRMLIAGLDPLRDDCINFMVKLIKNKVDAHAIEYQHLMHAFINQHEKPYELEEAKKALDMSIEIIKGFGCSD